MLKMLMPVNGMSSAVGMVCVLLMLALAAAGARQQHRASEYGISYHAGALSSRSESFNETMVELNSVLTEAYNAQRAIIVPGSEVFALESAARQVGHQGQVMILQSGAPAHTWGQIFGHSQIAYDVFRVKPEWTTRDGFRIFQPLAPQKVVAQIQERRPDVVFASHVDASTGLILPDAYIAEIGEATRAVNGLFVLEGIHAGQHWIDMEESMVDLYIAAPQKGLNGRAGFGIVLVGERALRHKHVAETESSSFALDLKYWRNVTDAYLEGRPVHSDAILPTETIEFFLGSMKEIQAMGWDASKRLYNKLGKSMRLMMNDMGLTSLVPMQYAAPGVIVVYVDDESVIEQLHEHGIHVETGIPLLLGESFPFPAFRMGAFGLDKMNDIEGAVSTVADAFKAILATRPKSDVENADDEIEL